MIVALMHKKYESFIKIRKFRNSYFSNRLGVVKNSTKLYIFLDLAKYYFIYNISWKIQ